MALARRAQDELHPQLTRRKRSPGERRARRQPDKASTSDAIRAMLPAPLPKRRRAMTAMNVVHMRVKPGKEDEFIRMHKEFDTGKMTGARDFWVMKSGERSFVIVGEWDSLEALAAGRPAMVGNLDRLRPILEDLGGGRGLTEPWSGEVAVHLRGR
jgi:hypothetical protein